MARKTHISLRIAATVEFTKNNFPTGGDANIVIEDEPMHDNPVDGKKLLICGEKSKTVMFSCRVMFSLDWVEPKSEKSWANQ